MNIASVIAKLTAHASIPPIGTNASTNPATAPGNSRHATILISAGPTGPSPRSNIFTVINTPGTPSTMLISVNTPTNIIASPGLLIPRPYTTSTYENTVPSTMNPIGT